MKRRIVWALLAATILWQTAEAGESESDDSLPRPVVVENNNEPASNPVSSPDGKRLSEPKIDVSPLSQLDEPFNDLPSFLNLGTEKVTFEENADTPAAVAPGSSNPRADDSWCCMPSSRWTVRADALWLKPSFDSVIGQTQLSPGGTVVDTLSLGNANIQSGMQLFLAYQSDADTSWESGYFGLQHWNIGSTIFGDVGAGVTAFSPFTYLGAPGPGGGGGLLGGFGDSLSYQYSANIHNAEFNRRRKSERFGWSLSRIFGLRYIQWTETLNVTGVDNFFGLTESIDTRTYNYLVGPQLGLGVHRNWNRLQVNLDGKAGLLANFMQRRGSNLNSTPGNPFGFVYYDDRQSRTGLAGVLDLAATGTYQVSRNISVRGGYQLLYIPGLATANHQLASGTPPAQGLGPWSQTGAFLHGPSVGFEWKR